MTDRERLARIDAGWMGWFNQDMDWLITQLKEAWAREERMREALEWLSASTVEINARVALDCLASLKESHE